MDDLEMVMTTEGIILILEVLHQDMKRGHQEIEEALPGTGLMEIDLDLHLAIDTEMMIGKGNPLFSDNSIYIQPWNKISCRVGNSQKNVTSPDTNIFAI